MPTGRSGSIKLFRLHGIEVFLHWSWFLVAVFEINSRAGDYSSVAWNVLEYLALFLIVLTHEFGHALACRSVGGIANRIVLWPLGGVAYVDPPPRPGATLWSIAAGPLVNVALIPILWLLNSAALSAGWAETMPNAMRLIGSISLINTWLLIFNILPIFPLDGGQILRSLLWFVMGRARSLLVATILGLRGSRGVHLLRLSCQLHLANHPGGLHGVELLGRTEAGASSAEDAEDPAARRLRLSYLQYARRRWASAGDAGIASKPLTPSRPAECARTAGRAMPRLVASTAAVPIP